MAQVFNTVATLVDPSVRVGTGSSEFIIAEANQLISHYWGSSDGDKMFIASFNYLDSLFIHVNKVALRVENIDNPQYVKAEWIPFIGYPLEEDVNRDDIYYFILSVNEYSQNEKSLTTGTNSNSIIARLGSDDDTYFAIFFASLYDLGRPGGTGNGTGMPGLKVPTGGG
jgi:hypothetical protein